MLCITIHFWLVFGLDSMLSTETGFGSEMDIIFQKQDKITWYKYTIRSSLVYMAEVTMGPMSQS